MDPTKQGIIVEAEATDCTIEIFINGLPVGLCGLGVATRFSRPVNEFLFDGANELAVLINPGDSPAKFQDVSLQPKPAAGAQPPDDPLTDEVRKSDAADAKRKADAERAAGRTPPPRPVGGGNRRWTAADINPNVKGLPASPDSRCLCRLMRYPVGAVQGDRSGQSILAVAWDANSIFNTLREEPQPYPRWARAKGDLGAMFGQYAWRSADALRAEAATFDAARRFIGDIREALMIGDTDGVLGPSTAKFDEVARAYGTTGDERRRLFRQIVDSQAPKDEWLFEDPEPGDFSLRLVGESRLIECVRPDWRPIVRQIPNPEGVFTLPMLIGRNRGEWRIFR